MGRLRGFGERAKSLGILSEWSGTFRKIVARLKSDPRGYGDPLYQLPRLRLWIHQMIVDRVVVLYGIHDVFPHVFVQDISPRLGHPLEED
jgi:hypothetical protein